MTELAHLNHLFSYDGELHLMHYRNDSGYGSIDDAIAGNDAKALAIVAIPLKARLPHG